jgi:hypothetical protein
MNIACSSGGIEVIFAVRQILVRASASGIALRGCKIARGFLGGLARRAIRA